MSELTVSTNTPNLVIERGKRAYQKIKADAVTMRENWRAVGEALLVGRKMHPSNQAFGKWCEEEFPGLHRNDRTDAMWFAENQAVAYGVCNSVCHPHHIRVAYNESLRTGPLPLDLAEIETQSTIELDQRAAEKVVKLVHRAQTGDEGSDIAKRHVESLAKKHSTTPEKLERAAARKAPELYHRLTPIQVASQREMEESVQDAVAQMISEGFTRQAIKDLFFNIIDKI